MIRGIGGSTDNLAQDHDLLHQIEESERAARTQKFLHTPLRMSAGDGSSSNQSGEFQFHGLPHSSSSKNVTVVSSSSDTCFVQLSSQVYVHEWLVQDIIDKKLLSDSLQQNQLTVEVNTTQDSSHEKMLKQAIQCSNKFSNLLLTLPAEFYTRYFFGCVHQFEDIKHYGKGDKLVMRAFFFNHQAYGDNEEFLSQTVAYQTQVLKLIDNPAIFPTVEEELFIVDTTSNEATELIGYVCFLKQPQLNLFQVIRDGWLRPKNAPVMVSDTFSREKLIFYLL